VYLTIPNEGILGRDYNKSGLEVSKISVALFNRSLVCVIDVVAPCDQL
jgi:hypothetical protein